MEQQQGAGEREAGRHRAHHHKHGYTTQIRAEEQEIKAAHYLFSRYLSLDKLIADEVKDAYRSTGYVDGKEYVLKEVRGEKTIASNIAHYEQRGFRDVRAVPIGEAQNP